MEVLNSFLKFGGRSSLDFGLTIEQPNIVKKAKKNVTRIAIPGKSGDYLFDDGSWSAVELSYVCWCKRKDRDRIIENVDEIAEWLQPAGYQILSDSYDPDYFRHAVCLESIDPEIIVRKYARQEIVFLCEAFKYSWAGDQEIRGLSGNVTLTNPERYEALPVITLKKGPGASSAVDLVVNRRRWEITVTDTIILDSQEMTCCLRNGTRVDGYKVGNGYPVFTAGENTISVPEGIELTIKPRWRRI